MNILWEDEYYLVLEKPAGVLSQPGGTGENMLTLASDLLRSRGESAKVYPFHRLDREVGGVFLLGKTGKSIRLLEGVPLQKEYLALIHGSPETSLGTFRDYLYHDPKTNKTFVVKNERKGVREAVLQYEVLWKKDSASLVSIHLETGRTHQIRIQFASRKMPLFGDRRYGAPESGPMGLWARELSFQHPVTGKGVLIRSPLPNTSPWTVLPEVFRQ